MSLRTSFHIRYMKNRNKFIIVVRLFFIKCIYSGGFGFATEFDRYNFIARPRRDHKTVYDAIMKYICM
jgi:hypothetical protein